MKYQAHPVVVEAFRIVAIGPLKFSQDSDHLVMPLELEGGKRLNATREQLARIMPAVGDYVVIQEDGYTYLNPKAVFERKYGPLTADRYNPDGSPKSAECDPNCNCGLCQ